MTKKIEEIFKKFMSICFPNVVHNEEYYKEWEDRFTQGMEWQASDGNNRRVLYAISPNVYPKNTDGFFIRE